MYDSFVEQSRMQVNMECFSPYYTLLNYQMELLKEFLHISYTFANISRCVISSSV